MFLFRKKRSAGEVAEHLFGVVQNAVASSRSLPITGASDSATIEAEVSFEILALVTGACVVAIRSHLPNSQKASVERFLYEHMTPLHEGFQIDRDKATTRVEAYAGTGDARLAIKTSALSQGATFAEACGIPYVMWTGCSAMQFTAAAGALFLSTLRQASKFLRATRLTL